jgi:hypothetical protein
MRYSPVFHLEDFFDRYSDLGQFFDGAHISFADILVDPAQERYQEHDIYASRTSHCSVTQNGHPEADHSPKHRKSSASTRKKHDLKVSHRNSNGNGHRSSNDALISPNGTVQRPLSDPNMSIQQHPLLDSRTPFPIQSNIPNLAQTPFSPPYAFSQLNAPEPYDPMFGMPGLGNSIPSSVHGTSYGYNMEQQTVMTPGGRSNGDSTGTGEGEKDPFLSLLEQLAENEHSRGGPSELDFFLSGGNS